MNIQEAKQEIINTVRAYTLKDETGAYRIPPEKQRPMLLVGPPGIGKTAILQQVAQELHIGLVSYTITHHTRQSAIGLPLIVKKQYGGREYSATEYTMSEIIASVYDEIDRTGVSEGILFLDEINCVSETLAPTMLQFLQYKTFGSHKVPDGYVIVTAGNPPEYNKSVRDFDIVTLDRVRKIEIEEDFDVWKRYAVQNGVHGAILSYLSIHRDRFYSIRMEVEDKYFVTARGWEDLSRILSAYEALHLPITRDLCGEYLQDPEIAKDFADYYALYEKYREDYRVEDILEGHYSDRSLKIGSAPFDEKLSLIGLLTDSLNQEFRTYGEDCDVQKAVFTELKAIRDADGAFLSALSDCIARRKQALQEGTASGILSPENLRCQKKTLAALEELESSAKKEAAPAFPMAKTWFADREKARGAAVKQTSDHLSHAFEFLARCFGEGQEMVIFLSELAGSSHALRFIRECGSDAYYRYNKLLLLQDRQDELTKEVSEVLLNL
ncbi:MAG: AAA family ATPase [Lachnospiraceae bacterium]